MNEMRMWFVSMMALCCMGVQAQETTEMVYPQAEWSKAGDILMYTPGQELFNGVIHPSAGLFEDYFDVDKAAEEHRGYMRMLEANGIRVHKVFDILKEVGVDSLRALAEKVLVYDISSIPDEDAEKTEAYRQEVLRKMSRNDMIRCILLQPTVKLSKTDNNTGYEAQYIQNPLMNLYFTRDQSITTPRGHVICNMNSKQRAPETEIINLCYEHLGLKPVMRITGEGRMEGGDYIPAGNISLIGCGMRTNDEGIRQMLEADAFGHDTIVDPEFNTCDIWARKPGTKEYTLWKRDQPFVEYIRGRGFQIIPIDYDDEMHYANNFLTIGPRHIMAVGGQSDALQQRFRDAGVNVEWIPLESLIAGYGAAHCMTQVLQREAYKSDEAPSAVQSVNTRAAESQPAYRLNGNVANDNDRGIIIQNGKKTIRTESAVK